MTTTHDPTPVGKITCLDCHKPLTRWDSRHRRRGQVCQDRADQTIRHGPDHADETRKE